MTDTKQCFEPILTANTKILILGSMPGVKSLEAQQYYAHPRNAFWRIMEMLTAVPFDTEYAARIEALSAIGIGLWDVLASCQREGSLDSNIDPNTICINDFQSVLPQLPNLKFIALNGGKAYQLFIKHVVKKNILAQTISYAALPSTSPAYASLNIEQKSKIWLDQLIAVC